MRETTSEATATDTRAAIPAVASLAVNPERIARMWAMTPAQRILAARRGRLTLGVMLRWAARSPQEVPEINGEWFFITAFSADAEERT